MEAFITEQAVPGGAVGGGCRGIGGGCGCGGGGPGGEAREGIIGDGILECYESLGLGLHYGHVFVGGGGRGSERHSQRQNLRRHCGMYDENKD